MFGRVAPIHIDGEQSAALAADVASQALQLTPFMVPVPAVSSYEGQDVEHERYEVVRIEVVNTKKFGLEVYG